MTDGPNFPDLFWRAAGPCLLLRPKRSLHVDPSLRGDALMLSAHVKQVRVGPNADARSRPTPNEPA